MSIKSRQRQAEREKALGLKKPVRGNRRLKQEPFKPEPLDILGYSKNLESVSKGNRDAFHAKQSKFGTHGNIFLNTHQREQKRIQRQATRQLAEMHNNNQLPLRSVKKTENNTIQDGS